ncbi:GIY-YIG nuclease family protein [Paenibacillus polymyxa]|uniref:GIY-YIG nuclease family protein n=1 Tax=Paenibacillus polymyxa TaxID=1406 RepID=UPI003B96B023
MPQMDFRIDLNPWHELEATREAYTDCVDGVTLIGEDYYAQRRSLAEVLLKNVDRSRGGIYIFQSFDSNLYVGKSSRLFERILQHLRGAGGATSIHVKEMRVVSGFHIDDPYERDIYETFTVKELRPRLNILKKTRWL